ncbi:hypothetical protein D3C76_634010 [compost metagenome]
MHQHLVQAFSELRCASCRLWHQEGSAFAGQILGVVGLVVVDRVGQRHQHRRQACCRQFADSQGTGPAHHQVGPAISLGHVFDERLYLSLDAHLVITLGGDRCVLLAGLVEHLWPQRRGHFRQGLRQQFVQWFRTQAATQHQQACAALAQGHALRVHEEFRAHRVAGGATLVAGLEGVRESFADPRREWHQQPIGGTGPGVLLMDHQWHAAQPRGHAAGAGHIAAKAQDTYGLELANDAPCLQYGLDQRERRLEQRQLALAAQAADLNQMQWQTRLWHQLVLDATRGAQPVHAVTALLELTGAGQRREYVPPGAAGHDQYIFAFSGHDWSPRQNRFR